jgi:excisionase family DNA binding protein
MTEGRILYRPGEAAAVLGLSRARLYQLLAAGELGSVKIGGSRRIPTADLQAYVSRLRANRDAPSELTPRQDSEEVERVGG